jgi:hypothetical protein
MESMKYVNVDNISWEYHLKIMGRSGLTRDGIEQREDNTYAMGTMDTTNPDLARDGNTD